MSWIEKNVEDAAAFLRKLGVRHLDGAYGVSMGGICTLLKELGIAEIVPAMCRLDYAMSDAGGTTEFVRQYTLASGGPYCDCGYKKRRR